MTPARLNKILKIALALVIVLAIALLYLSFRQLQSTANKTTELKAMVEVSRKRSEVYQLNKVRVESLSYVDELAKQVLPADQDQSVIVAEISEFALRSSLEIASLTFDDNVSGGASANSGGAASTNKGIPEGVRVVPITIQLKQDAEYSGLLNYLRTMEQNRRKMQVTTVTLKPSENDDSRLASVIIKLNLYAKKSTSEQKQ